MCCNKKPILLNTKMVKAVLDGIKTQIRRLAKGRNFKVDYVPSEFNESIKDNIGNFYFFEKNKIKNKWKETINYYDSSSLEKLSSLIAKNKDFPFNVGDILYVRETWCYGSVVGDSDEHGNEELWLEQLQEHEDNEIVFYKADMDEALNQGVSFDEVVWKPAIHMPKKYARIFLKVTNVRVEKLHDISHDDIYNEGFPSDFYKKGGQNFRNWFVDLWNSTAKDGYKWEDNPLVFVYEFERIDLNKS